MKRSLLILLAIPLLALTPPARVPIDLYPIFTRGLWGYINDAGEVVIAPQFRAAAPFSEGLAAVRKDGTYGYIDLAGSFAIAPQYDYADPFQRGIARVYRDGRPLFIDGSGRVLFEHEYESIGEFGERDYTVATTRTGKKGVIDRSGRLLGDTIFAYIGPFNEGHAVAVGYDTVRRGHEERITMIDSMGRPIVPFGTYAEIGTFSEGIAWVRVAGKSERALIEGFIDGDGKLLFRLSPSVSAGYYGTAFHDGLACVEIAMRDTIIGNSNRSRDRYYGAIDRSGKVVMGKPEWESMTRFSDGRAFVEMDGYKWYLIDRTGESIAGPCYEISSGSYQDAPPFQRGVALVKQDKEWRLIDTAAHFISAPRPLSSSLDDVHQYGRLVRFSNLDRSTSRYLDEDAEKMKVGYWDAGHGVVIEPRYDYVEAIDEETGPIAAWNKGAMSYIDRGGRTIWSGDPEQPDTPRPLHLDFMTRGYFYAASSGKIAHYNGHVANGRGPSLARKIDFDVPRGTGLVLRFMEDASGDTVQWEQGVCGVTLRLINPSLDTLFFDAQDSRIEMVLQAKDRDGEWRDIEYLPSSWCGNSYHTVALAGGEYWEFVAPRYEGETATKIRAKVYYMKKGRSRMRLLSDEEEVAVDTLYSNEIDGGVNPGQFWRKPEYYPSDMMDPYHD